MIIETDISWGYVELIKIFFKANELDVCCEERKASLISKITLSYEDNSETALSITFMSYRHLGFENMLYDYLKRCGVDLSMIPIGRFLEKRDMDKLDKEWQDHRKTIGLNNYFY